MALGFVPASAQDTSVTMDQAMRYSLVAVRDASSLPSDRRPDCGEVVCVDSFSTGSFSGVTTLAGPDLGESFAAGIVIHRRLDREGVLAIVRTDAQGRRMIEALARGNGEGGKACLSVSELERFGLDGTALEVQRGTACYPVGGRLFDGDPVQVGAAAPETTSPVEPTIAVVEFTRRAPFIGVPAHCADGSQICFAELYQGQATPVRHISGDELPRRFTLRLTSHAMRITAGSHLLVLALPFTDGETQGYFAHWWDGPHFDGLYCMAEDRLARLDPGPLRSAFEQGVSRHQPETRDFSAADYRCIWDS